jgi:hypothetical protein
MTYRPIDEFFGPPFSQRVFAFAHALIAALLIAFVYYVSRGPQDSAVYHYMFRQKHMMSTETAAGFFALSSVFSMIRDSMRGVKIRANWLEYRDIVSSVWPRVRRFRWAQIDQINFEKSGLVSVDVWDGTREFLPVVREPERLRTTLERLATARAIAVRGGRGVDELDEVEGEDD